MKWGGDMGRLDLEQKNKKNEPIFFEYMPATFDQPTLFEEAQLERIRETAKKIWISALALFTFLAFEAVVFYAILKYSNNL